MKKKVAVIGAGMVGACVASYLQRDGHDVVIIDPNEPGEGASFGNAGCFNPSSMVPIAGPDTFRQVPGYLMDPLGPLAIRWRYLPQIAPWLLRYGLAGTPKKIRHQAAALHSILHDSLGALMPLVRDAGAEHLVKQEGILIAYRHEKTVAGDKRGWDLRKDFGVQWEELDRNQLREFDPNLSDEVKFGKHVINNGHTINPSELVKALIRHVLGNGGTFVRAEAYGFDTDGSKLRGVQTNTGLVEVDTAVIAAGIHSRKLAKDAGDSVPLDSERGYHITLKNPEVMPRIPTTDSENKVVVSPMNTGVRIAGTVELAGTELAPNWQRATMMLDRIGTLFPKLGRKYTPDELTVWMGHRPSLPDSLPVLGASKRSPDILHCFGHQHVGMTAAPQAGVIISDLVTGRKRNDRIDLEPFRAERF